MSPTKTWTLRGLLCLLWVFLIEPVARYFVYECIDKSACDPRLVWTGVTSFLVLVTITILAWMSDKDEQPQILGDMPKFMFQKQQQQTTPSS